MNKRDIELKLFDKTIVDKKMYFSNDNKQKYPFSILKLLIEKFGHQPNKFNKTTAKDFDPTNETM